MDFAEDCKSKYFQPDKAAQHKQQEYINQLKSSKNCQDSSFNSSSSDELSLSQLDIQEQEVLEIPPFFNMTPREMPYSPHYVVEEDFRHNPWAMLIATIFLTKTTAKNARPYLKDFFKEFPTPYHILDVSPISLEKFFENIGLRKRAHIIWRLTFQFVSAKWRRASDLCGVGKYGEDAYRIFCLGHTDLEPNDRFLRLYLEWLRSQTDFLDEQGVIDSECMIEDVLAKYYSITLRS